jgi:hypothetical protein
MRKSLTCPPSPFFDRGYLQFKDTALKIVLLPRVRPLLAHHAEAKVERGGRGEVACIRDCVPPFDLSLLLLRSTSTISSRVAKAARPRTRVLQSEANAVSVRSLPLCMLSQLNPLFYSGRMQPRFGMIDVALNAA